MVADAYGFGFGHEKAADLLERKIYGVLAHVKRCILMEAYLLVGYSDEPRSVLTSISERCFYAIYMPNWYESA